jgi:hypothetical protein
LVVERRPAYLDKADVIGARIKDLLPQPFAIQGL